MVAIILCFNGVKSEEFLYSEKHNEYVYYWFLYMVIKSSYFFFKFINVVSCL